VPTPQTIVERGEAVAEGHSADRMVADRMDPANLVLIRYVLRLLPVLFLQAVEAAVEVEVPAVAMAVRAVPRGVATDRAVVSRRCLGKAQKELTRRVVWE
jgi:hypothetical protein